MPKPIYIHVQFPCQYGPCYELDTWRRERYFQPEYAKDVVYCVEACYRLYAKKLRYLLQLLYWKVLKLSISFEDLLVNQQIGGQQIRLLQVFGKLCYCLAVLFEYMVVLS